jgi:hypothetical protein
MIRWLTQKRIRHKATERFILEELFEKSSIILQQQGDKSSQSFVSFEASRSERVLCSILAGLAGDDSRRNAVPDPTKELDPIMKQGAELFTKRLEDVAEAVQLRFGLSASVGGRHRDRFLHPHLAT